MKTYKLLRDMPTVKAGTTFREITKEEAEKSIKENERDWKIYFGIKE